MSARSLFSCALMLVGLMFGAGCGKGDFSTPKAAVKTFAAAMENGDAETAKKACTGGDPKTIEAWANALGNLKSMREAAISKFGDEGKTVEYGTDSGVANADKLDGFVEKIDGDKATVTPKDGMPAAHQFGSAFNLKKVDGDWKVDVSELNGAGGLMGVPMFDSMGKAAKEVTDEINAGKYKSAAEANAALGEKMVGGMFGGGVKP